MWLEALDLVFERLTKEACDFSRIAGVSGAGMQHGTVYWTSESEKIMGTLDPQKALVEQLTTAKAGVKGAFSHEFSPNWQDASTQHECDQFDAALGGPDMLAKSTG